MELFTGSRHLACAISTGLDVSGRQHLVVVAKASWQLPQAGARPRPIAPQPICLSDDFHGAPGESPLRYGADLARTKPRCDVLVDGCAHAPESRPVKDLLVGLQVGPLRKALKVIGPRSWRKSLGGAAPGEPQPFTCMPLHYGHAFGGTLDDDADQVHAFAANPAGLGWAPRDKLRQMTGRPAPNLEAIDDPVRSPHGRYRPVALGAVARHWEPRAQRAGTYDAAWKRDVYPYLPADFDDRFEQCAADDQQIDYPTGGESVTLTNLLPGRPELRFALPAFDAVKVRVLRRDYSAEELPTVVDTLFFETEQDRFSAVWRAATPIRRRIQEFDTIAVGPVDPDWWRAKTLGIDADCGGCTKVAA
jgi:hypothetical protein